MIYTTEEVANEAAIKNHMGGFVGLVKDLLLGGPSKESAGVVRIASRLR